MNKSWRPQRWEEIKQHILPLRFESLDPEPFKFVEAGADALLTSLLSSGVITIESLEALNKYGDVKGSAK